MRKVILVVPALLAACATAPASPPPIEGAVAGSCRPDSASSFVGQEATSETGAGILRATGARVLRWVQPGMMVTMDYRSDRVTVMLAAGNRIERISCG